MSEQRLEGQLLLGGELVPGTLVLEGGRIKAVERGVGTGAGSADLPILAPGLIDLHVHGFAGCDPLRGIVDGVGEFRAEGGAAQVRDGGLAGMASALARAGTTAFQPTLFPAEPARLGAKAAA
ncbi:MAG: amidohydrolase family protein, partial [Planctomycetota bacterium]|nr:amidohydrolase family protein [Planctomycetota bacterium]